jgi:hypothetical protein
MGLILGYTNGQQGLTLVTMQPYDESSIIFMFVPASLSRHSVGVVTDVVTLFFYVLLLIENYHLEILNVLCYMTMV